MSGIDARHARSIAIAEEMIKPGTLSTFPRMIADLLILADHHGRRGGEILAKAATIYNEQKEERLCQTWKRIEASHSPPAKS